MATQIQALVIGAGISGLATAYALQKAGISVLIVDSAPRPGGVIQSVKRDGYLLECGPQSFSGNAHLTSLCTDLGLLDDRVLADPKAPRYVLINGQLKNVPMSPAILTSAFLGGGTRERHRARRFRKQHSSRARRIRRMLLSAGNSLILCSTDW